MTKSLGLVLAVCLAGLQFLAVLAVVSSSYVTSERALLQHARDLLRDVGVNTIEHSKGFLNPAEGAAELAARLAQNRVIASDNPVLLEQLLFQQLQIASQFAGVYYGAEDGSFVYVMHDPGGPGPFRSKIINIVDGQRQTELIWRNNDFRVVKRQMDPTDTYDPRSRPWYKQARADLTTIWTDPYIFFSSQQPGITLAAPVMNGTGTRTPGIRGVVGVDIEISMISHFLSRLNIGESGKALIIHRNGDVIAHPDLNLIKTTSDDGTLRFANIQEFDDPIARAAFGPLVPENRIIVAQETPSQFVHAGASYVSTVMPAISDKLPWTIAVYAPENDFTAVIKQNRATNIWIAALVAALTGLIGLVLANYIHKPVRAFAVRSALIAQGEIDPAEPLPKTYRELERANETLVQEIVARRETEREYGQTFDLSSRGMAQVMPRTGAFIRVNGRFSEITGYTPEEMAGMRMADLVPEGAVPVGDAVPGPAGEVVIGPTEVQAGEPSVDQVAAPALNHEMRIRRKDGSSIWVSVNAIVIRDGGGRPLHAVVTMDDISKSKERDSQIDRLNRDLSHLARGNTMGQMASGLAHELNQPLTAIAQNADTALLVLAQTPHPDPELGDILREIERQSLRAGDIIRALRSFVRKDEGIRTVVDLPELLDQSLRLVHAEVVEAKAVIETDLPADLPRIDGSRVQIAQVIINLLRNALEAMAATSDPERRITLTARQDGGFVRVAVQDTGPGIDPAISLFTQFETSKPDGMGLGVSICRSMIEANGGALWLDGDDGPGGTGRRGARFVFTLPIHLS